MLLRGNIICGTENKSEDVLEIESPLYPKLPNPAIRLTPTDELPEKLRLQKQFMVECGKSNEQTMKSSAYYIVAESSDLVVQRYSDKYKGIRCSDNMIDWKPDWSGLPAELAVKVRKPKRLGVKKGKQDRLDVSQVLDKLATNENKEEEPEDEADENEEEKIAVDHDDDEEDDDDYTSNYFDNGEAVEDEEEDTLDEPATW